MIQILITFLSMSYGASSTNALAKTPYRPSIVPECQVVQLLPGVKRCAYTLEQIKEVYLADLELVKLRNISLLQGQKINLQRDIISWQQEQLGLSVKNSILSNERMNSLTKLYIKTDSRLQKELAKPKWGSHILWGAVIAVTAAFTGYIVADQIGK